MGSGYRDIHGERQDLADATTDVFRQLLIKVFGELDCLPGIFLLLKSMPFLLMQGVSYSLDHRSLTQLVRGTPYELGGIRLPPGHKDIRIEFGKVFIGDSVHDLSKDGADKQALAAV